MRTKILLPLILLVFLFSCASQKEESQKENRSKYDYPSAWQRIESLEKKGLERTAIQELNMVVENAIDENELEELFKALAIRSKFIQEIDEHTTDEIVQLFQEKITQAESPAKELLSSALAELYHQYLQANLWTIRERTKRQRYDANKLSLMAEDEILETAKKYYLESLNNSEISLSKPLPSIEGIYTGYIPDSSYLKHFSIYDLLAIRALGFLKTTAFDEIILEPIAYEEDFIIPLEQFLEKDLASKAKREGLKNWLAVLQKSLQLQKNNKEALHYYNLLRLKSSLEFSQLPNQAERYRSVLRTEIRNAGSEIIRDELRSELAVNLHQANRAKEAIAICTDCEDPESFGSNRCEELSRMIRSPHHRADMELVYSTDRPILFSYQYRNIDKAYFKIIALEEEEVWDPLFSAERIRATVERKAVREWSVGLKNWDDFQDHRTELLTSDLGCGDYLLIASNTKSFNLDSSELSITHFKISNISYLLRDLADGGKELRIKDRSSGIDLNDVLVTLFSAEYNPQERRNNRIKVRELTTNGSGRVKIAADERHNNLSFRIEHKDQHLISAQRLHIFPRRENDQTRLYTNFFTDRSIYRPGQTLHFKGILYESKGSERRILASRTSTVRIYDSRGEEIGKQEVRSNQLGSFAGSFVLPSNSVNGSFRIANEYGNLHFRLEEYRRPSMKIEFDSTEKAYQNGDTISFKGWLNSYTGFPINQASIDYKIIRKSLFFPRPMFSSYFPPSKEIILKSGKLRLEDNHFEVSFKSSKDPLNQNSVIYEIRLTATSAFGESVSSSKSLIIGEVPYSLHIESEENLNLESLNQTVIKAIDLNGDEREKKGEVRLWRLKRPSKAYLEKFWPEADHQIIEKNEYTKLFPSFAYQEEWELDSLKKELLISKQAFQTNDPLEGYRKLEEGAYLLEVYSLSEKGDTIRAEKRFRFYDDQSNKPSVPEYFHSFAPLRELREGETIRLQLTSAFNMKVLIELQDQKEVIFSKEIELSKEKRWIEIPTLGRLGEMQLYLSAIAKGRAVSHIETFLIHPKEKALEIELQTKRDYTAPDQKEEWSLLVKNSEPGEKVEVLASAYDHSLDKIEKQIWYVSTSYIHRHNYAWNIGQNFGLNYARNYSSPEKFHPQKNRPQLPYLNWFGFYFRGNYRGMPAYNQGIMLSEVSSMRKGGELRSEANMEVEADLSKQLSPPTKEDKVRDDFRETVFFYPQLQKGESNEVNFSFQMPDALTEWRFRAIAHNEKLEFSQLDHLFVSRKELSIQSYLPRFFRTKDQAILSFELRNISHEIINGVFGIEFRDARSGEVIDVLEEEKDRAFQLLAGASKTFSYSFLAPSNASLLKYKVFAKGESHQDIEEGYLTILPSTILITETYPFEVDKGTKRTIEYKRFAEKQDQLRNKSYTVEYTSDPRWLAVYSLPSMVQTNEEMPESIFSKLFANALAGHTARKLVDNNEAIENIFKQKEVDSQLQQNQDLLDFDLEVSPWKSAVEEEKEQRRKLSQLFDDNQRQYALDRGLNLLKELQLSSGAWPWHKGMKANRYISQYISLGLGRLKKIGLIKEPIVEEILTKAYTYLDEEISKEFERMNEIGIEEGVDYLDPMSIHYLYSRSFDKGWKPNAAAVFYLQQTEQFWTNKNVLLKAQIALTHHQLNPNNSISLSIIASLRDQAIRDSLGVHWRFDKYGPDWHLSAVEAQAYLIELFQAFFPNDKDLDEMKKWLLHQKKQQYWPGNIASSSACYALLKEEKNLSINGGESMVVVGKESLNTTGFQAYRSKSWNNDEIEASLSKVQIEQGKNHFGWGALYWKYYEEQDKVGSHSKDGLKIKSEYFHYQINSEGKEELIPASASTIKIGDLIRQRTEVIIDVDLDFVFISDHPPACLESIENRSGIEYKQGLSFYSNLKDTEKQWFIDHLEAGRYVFETDYRVTHSGTFTGGVSRLQSAYAAEYSAYANAGSLKIEK